MLVITLIH